jgi:hypothetical protein
MSEPQLLALPAPARAAIIAAAECDARCILPRKLSPAEVFQRHHTDPSQTMRVPLPVIAEILYLDLAREARADKGEFTVQDIEIAPQPLHFESRILRTDGREEELKQGEIYELVINPYDPQILTGGGTAFVYSSVRQKGAFLGLARRVQRHCRADHDAAVGQHKRIATRMSDLLAGTRSRHASTSQAIAARKAANLATLTGHIADDQAAAEDALAALSAIRQDAAQDTGGADEW